MAWQINNTYKQWNIGMHNFKAQKWHMHNAHSPTSATFVVVFSILSPYIFVCYRKWSLRYEVFCDESPRDTYKQQVRSSKKKTKDRDAEGLGWLGGLSQIRFTHFSLLWFETDPHGVYCPSHRQWDMTLCSSSRGCNSNWMSISL